MSLTAQIRIESPRGLMLVVFGMGSVGVIISLLTLVARHRVREDVLLPVIFIVLVLAIVMIDLLRIGIQHRPVFAAAGLRIQEDGRIVLENGTDGVENADSLYRLAPDALFWPGLFVLRLQAEVNDDDNESGQVRTLIALKGSLSESSCHGLARLLIWAQRKGAGDALSVAGLATSLSLKPTP